jgi:hypothetical protein
LKIHQIYAFFNFSSNHGKKSSTNFKEMPETLKINTDLREKLSTQGKRIVRKCGKQFMISNWEIFKFYRIFLHL